MYFFTWKMWMQKPRMHGNGFFPISTHEMRTARANCSTNAIPSMLWPTKMPLILFMHVNECWCGSYSSYEWKQNSSAKIQWNWFECIVRHTTPLHLVSRRTVRWVWALVIWIFFINLISSARRQYRSYRQMKKKCMRGIEARCAANTIGPKREHRT